ncbi:MAG: hypothetical protein OER43_17965 [Gammaproteobacteria bacterium]|nr:hypothetical protein [Gammaproteobacteria bacterium]
MRPLEKTADFVHPSSFNPAFMMPTIRTGSIGAHAHWAPEAYVRNVVELGR